MSVFTQLKEPVMYQSLQLIYSTLKERPILLYAQLHLYKDSYKHLTINTDPDELGCYPKFIAWLKKLEEHNEEVIKHHKEQWNHQEEQATIFFNSHLSLWDCLADRYLQHELNTSEHHLAECTYTVMDPHVSGDGVRHKTMRVLPPSEVYRAASEVSTKSITADRESSTESESVTPVIDEKEEATSGLLSALRRLTQGTKSL